MTPSADHNQLAKMLLAVSPILAFYMAVANIYVITILAAASSMILINTYLENSRKKLNPPPLWVIPLLALARILLGNVVETDLSILIVYVIIILVAQKIKSISKLKVLTGETEAIIATPIIAAIFALYYSTYNISWSIAGPIIEPLFITMIVKSAKNSKQFAASSFLAGTITGSFTALPPIMLTLLPIIFNAIKCKSSSTKIVTLAIFLDCIFRIFTSHVVETWNIATY